ncbi:hypothetical protein SLEP1_g29199 [Rubroshorea leprosula]|uniref:Uncharacterized protein n=1 Tax=Rubroshorea leprosula TaxID=152421 RepID=A0AAV5JW48_9ROSI|nr:hypothetical protein SLEP1_g29199 [Rubroshorea leprosula]
MSQYQGDEMDYQEEDDEMAQVGEGVHFHGRRMGDSESEEEDDEYGDLVVQFTP